MQNPLFIMVKLGGSHEYNNAPKHTRNEIDFSPPR